jgi:hypothetical protein
MRSLRPLFVAIVMTIGCFPLADCAAVVGADKAPREVWEKLAGGEQQDLIIVFDDSAIVAEASQMNKAKGIMFDDNDTMRFKVGRYAAIKRDAIAALPSGKVEILKNYDTLPLMFLRFHSTAALKQLLAHSSVVKAYRDRQENTTPRNSRP